MKFNAYINSILENIQRTLPVDDGEREIYEVAYYEQEVVGGGDDDADFVHRQSELMRIDPRDYDWWDRVGIDSAIDVTQYEGNSFQEAFEALKYALKINKIDLSTINFQDDPVLREFVNLKGVWKVVWGEESHIVNIGVEVDVPAYSIVKHTAEELYGF